MNNNSDNLIKPYKIDRVCKPHPDIDQLSLKQVDTTESIYSRVLVQLKDASLPDSVYDRIDQTERTLHKISINPETNQPTHPEPPARYPKFKTLIP